MRTLTMNLITEILEQKQLVNSVPLLYGFIMVTYALFYIGDLIKENNRTCPNCGFH